MADRVVKVSQTLSTKKRQNESYCEIIVIWRFKSPFLVTQFISTPI